MSDKTWITGEFVETVQLQVVCQTLINKLAPNATEISMEHLEAYGSLDKALQVFYEDSIREVVEKTKDLLRHHGECELKEGVLRNWFEKKLITPAQTRGLAYRGTTHTEGLPNEAIDVLDQAHIIREERRGSGRWYELSHDRFIDPILTSNKEWLVQFSGAAKVRQWLEERSARWNKAQDEGVLLSENELAEADRWVKSVEASELGYDPTVTSLIQASRANLKTKRRERELEIESAQRLARSARRFKWASVGLAVMFLLALASTAAAVVLWNNARNNLHLTERLREDALKTATHEAEAKQRAENAERIAAARAEQAEKARADAEKARGEAEKARRESERTKGQLRGALDNVKKQAEEARKAHQTDQLSREAFRLSRRPESQQDAIEQFNHAIKVYGDTGDRDAQVDSYLNQGQVYRDMGEEERAEDSFNKALQLYRAKPADPLKQATTLNNIGVIYSSSSGSADGEPNDEALASAKTKFYTALAIFRKLQDSLGEAATLTNLGDAQLSMTAPDERTRAPEFYEAAAGIYDELLKDKSKPIQEKPARALFGLMISVANKSPLLSEIDETFSSSDERFDLYREALKGYTDLKDKRAMAMVHNKMAEAAEEALESAQGERIERYQKLVEENYQQAAQLYKESQDPVGEAGAHIKLGGYYQSLEDQEKWRKAIDEFHRALSIYENIQDRPGQVRAHKLLYEFYSKSSNPADKSKAVDALVRVNELYGSLENITGQSDTYLKLGSLYESLQDREKAEKAFKAALDLYENSRDSKTQADILSKIGSIYATSKEKSGVELAIQRYTQAAGIYQGTVSLETLAKTYDRLAEIHSQSPWNLGFSNDEAIQWYNKAIHYYETEADIYRSKTGSKDAPAKVAKVLRLIGIVYRDRLGDKAKALDLFNQSLKLYQEAKNSVGMRTVRNDIANLTGQSSPQNQSKP